MNTPIHQDYPPVSIRPSIELVMVEPLFKRYTEPVHYFSEADRIVTLAKQFQNLPEDWAGKGSLTPKTSTIANLNSLCAFLKDKHLKLLNVGDIVPSPHGTISLYFEDQDNNELSIEIGSTQIGICGSLQGQTIICENLTIADGRIVAEHLEKLVISE